MPASVPPEFAALLSVCLAGGPRAARIRAVKSALQGASGQQLREEIGNWIAQLLPIEMLVPDVYSRWRSLVRDAFRFVFTHLSDARLATKLVEQFDMPLDTPPASRLLRLIAKMPGIQKLGQVLARHQHLCSSLRKALSELENGMSDVSAGGIHAIISKQLGPRLQEYAVRVDPAIFCEASVSAVVRFTWRNPDTRKRERGVFKVLKPYVPRCFAEDLALLQQLSEFLAANRGYGFATHHIAEMVAEVRLLLEHELDFKREQATLRDALRTYRLTLGVRVPHLIALLCTPRITAMTEEDGVKITEAFPRQPQRRLNVAEQLIEALIAVPLLSREEETVLHADPHAGNLLYDEDKHELVILDWALTERLSREARRQLAMLVIMTSLRNVGGVSEAIERLASSGRGSDTAQAPLIKSCAERYFDGLPYNHFPGSLEAMQLLDEIALAGVRFPAALAMFQKALFTLDGVLHDIAGSKVPISRVLIRDFVVRGLASFGLNHPPLSIADLMALERSALLYPVRWGASAVRDALAARSAPESESAR